MAKKPVPVLPVGYAEWLVSLKQRIQGARQRALLAANEEQIRLYHDIGREILDRQRQHRWGAKVIDRVASDLRAAFPDMKGLSSRNLKYMKTFAQKCPHFLIGQQSAAQLPWFHIVTLITSLSDTNLRDWYAREALHRSWPRGTLALQIKNQLHLRQGAAVTNFQERLAPPEAGLASQILKDPYHFDLLGLGEEAHERDIETRLKCYAVVELRAHAFKPEHAGQLNFYLATVDAQIKASDDRPTIGLLLCRNQNRLVAEYALSGIDKPIGVAEYQLVRALPEPLDTSLPSIAEIEAELSQGLGDRSLA